MAFFTTPGTEALYSGEAMMTAWTSWMRSRSAEAPLGQPLGRLDISVVRGRVEVTEVGEFGRGAVAVHKRGDQRRQPGVH